MASFFRHVCKVRRLQTAIIRTSQIVFAHSKEAEGFKYSALHKLYLARSTVTDA
jgi:hypothetical protein